SITTANVHVEDNRLQEYVFRSKQVKLLRRIVGRFRMCTYESYNHVILKYSETSPEVN
ncbi:hypothetical protein ALC53_08534, partial [Atta colombica]